MALSEITQKMMAVSRFGCDIIRLTRGKKGHEEPYGPIQVRFCDGAMLPMADLEKAGEMADFVAGKIADIVSPLCIEYKGRMRSILNEEVGPDQADELHELANWIDSMEQDSVMVLTQGEGCVVGLNGYWCCHVPEGRDREAKCIASALKDAMSIIRHERLSQLQLDLQDAIDV